MVSARNGKHFRLTPAIAILIIALVVASLFHIVLEADHDCCGEGCHVCAGIMLCSETVRKIGICAFLLSLVYGMSRLAATCLKSTATAFAAATPVAFRTRLND